MFSPQKSQVGFAARNEIARTETLPAPVGGLNLRDPEASMRPIYATQMENFWPQESFITVRKGATEHVGEVAFPVKQLATWKGTAGEKLFAFTDSGAYDVSTAAASVAVVSTPMTSGDVVTANFRTSGKSHLVVVNGVDDIRYYDGSTWTTTPSFTVSGGTTINSKDITYVNVHQRALFFLLKESMTFYFMAPDQYATSVSQFPLGGLFNKGGKLVAMGTWTLDGGEDMTDLAAFITSEGQVAVYGGTNPGAAADWVLKGVYDLGKPLGRTPVYKLGADLLILTTYGLTSMTKLIKEGWSDKKTTLTDIISSRFQLLARGAESSPEWRVIADPRNALLLINVPAVDNRPQSQLAMNLVTTAWTTFTGWPASCWASFQGELFAGLGKRVGRMWQQGGDFGARIPCYAQCAWTYLSPKTRMKKLNLLRMLIRANGRLSLLGAVDVDFNVGISFSPILTLSEELSRFDVSRWNEGMWGSLPSMTLDWLDLSAPEGRCLAPRLQLFAADATFEWSAIDYVYTVGAIMG